MNAHYDFKTFTARKQYRTAKRLVKRNSLKKEEETQTCLKKAHGRRCPRFCNATATDAKIGYVSFYTSLYTDIKMHSSWEVCFAQRNALQVAIVCFEYTVFTARKEKLVRSSPLKIILFGLIAKRE